MRALIKKLAIIGQLKTAEEGVQHKYLISLNEEGGGQVFLTKNGSTNPVANFTSIKDLNDKMNIVINSSGVARVGDIIRIGNTYAGGKLPIGGKYSVSEVNGTGVRVTEYVESINSVETVSHFVSHQDYIKVN